MMTQCRRKRCDWEWFIYTIVVMRLIERRSRGQQTRMVDGGVLLVNCVYSDGGWLGMKDALSVRKLEEVPLSNARFTEIEGRK